MAIPQRVATTETVDTVGDALDVCPAATVAPVVEPVVEPVVPWGVGGCVGASDLTPIQYHSLAASTNAGKFIMPFPVTGSHPLLAGKPCPQNITFNSFVCPPYALLPMVMSVNDSGLSGFRGRVQVETNSVYLKKSDEIFQPTDFALPSK